MKPSESSSMSEVRAQRRAELDAPRVDTRTAILRAIERTVEEYPLHTLSVAQIIEAAGVSRGAFYSYFESKYDAAGALITDLIDEALELWKPYLEQGHADPLGNLTAALRDSLDLWEAHRGIGFTYHQYWHSVPELRDQWMSNFERFVASMAEALDGARARGTLPPGEDSHKLASAGMWMTEQLISVSLTGASKDLEDREFVLQSIVRMWIGLLFGDRWPEGSGS